MDTSALREILEQEVHAYTGMGLGSVALPVFDVEREWYAIAVIDYPVRRWQAGLFLVARLMGDRIIIEHDSTDKPLIDALLQRGVPEHQIIPVYKKPASELDESSLKEILREEIIAYSGIGAGSIGIPVIDEEKQHYIVADIDASAKDWPAGLVMFARIFGNKIIIETDSADIQLTKALLYRGVPREQLILAYDGEALEIEVEAWIPQL